MSFLQKINATILLIVLFQSCSNQESESADILIFNGKVWTGNEQSPLAEAIAIKGERIFAVGSNLDLKKYESSSTNVIDASDGLVSPGFIDSHVHFIEGGFRLASVQLRDAETIEEFATRIGEFANTLDSGVWITGGDWNHELWGGELPSKEWVDSLTPNNPVWVSRLDGHMALANSLTLQLAGVDKSTKAVEGGEIVKDENGIPTGMVKDNAMNLVYQVMPETPDNLNDRALEAAMDYMAENGVTSVHHMGTWDDLAVLERANSKGKLTTRIYASVPLNSWDRLSKKVKSEGNGDEWLKIGGLKGFVDGSLGSHTAAFFEDFDDTPGEKGFFVTSYEDLLASIQQADSANLQLSIHAIGDSAINTILNVFENVQAQNKKQDRRFRIEHAQHIASDDFSRFDDLDVIASMQPYHAIDDGRWAEKVIGDRINTTYAFKTLLDNQARVAFGSDWFVAPPIPLEGIYAAVTRRTLDDQNLEGWVPEQIISVDQALKAYTSTGAYASFDEDIKGSLEVGKLADIVILGKDITTIDPVNIGDVSVRYTIVGGRIIYSNDPKK